MLRVFLYLICLSAAIPATASEATRNLSNGMRLRAEYGTQGFEFVFHEPSQKWVGQECQVRVLASRKLPEPLAPAKQDPWLSMQLFGGLSVETASITGGVQNVQRFEAWRWWWFNRAVGDVELKSPQRLGVQVSWPSPKGAGDAITEPMEIFTLPSIDGLPPETWTSWRGPEALRAGSDAWYAEVHRRNGRQLVPADLAQPFEIRCRAGLWETPYRRKKPS